MQQATGLKVPSEADVSEIETSSRLASRDGVLDAAWQALTPGGRLVVNSVTLETEAILIARQVQHGGTLLRLSVEHAGAVGALTGWRAAMPVVQWSVTK